MLEERLEKTKEALRQKDAIIKDKDARISALNEQRTSNNYGHIDVLATDPSTRQT